MHNRFAFPLAFVTILGGSAESALAATANYTCSLPQTCALFDNTSSGQGIRAEANTGYGIYATSLTGTGFFGSSGSGSYLNPGVDAESTNGANYSDAAAVFGLQGDLAGTQPAFGALSYGSVYGLYGFAANPGNVSSNPGFGVYGQDNETTKGFDYNAGVVGTSSYGTGMLAESNGAPTLGLIGDVPIGLYAVSDPYANEAIAIEGESTSFPLQATNTKVGTVFNAVDASYLIDATTTSGSPGTSAFFFVTNAGNADLSGTLTTSKGTYDRTRGASGAVVTSYGQRSTVPTLEDMGEAELVNGRASVLIDAKLADVIDHRTNYLVFLTPEGDSKGLYITQKGPGGFVVREQQGGHSTLVFDYRIVAKPLNQDGARLAAASPMRGPISPIPPHGSPVSRPLSPFDRLRARLGAAGFASAVRRSRAGR